MSAYGPTFRPHHRMFAFGAKADICRSSRRGLVNQAAQRQLRDIGNVAIAKVAASAQCEHRGDTL